MEFYSASIPALLALSEGICKDNYPDIGLFSKHTKNKMSLPKTENIFDKISPLDVFEEAVLKPLRISTDITKSIRNPTEQEHTMFNRHLIMHGLSRQYGHKDNSLKAISMVYFVHNSLMYLKEKNT
jgi:hypothetical protein